MLGLKKEMFYCDYAVDRGEYIVERGDEPEEVENDRNIANFYSEESSSDSDFKPDVSEVKDDEGFGFEVKTGGLCTSGSEESGICSSGDITSNEASPTFELDIVKHEPGVKVEHVDSGAFAVIKHELDSNAKDVDKSRDHKTEASSKSAHIEDSTAQRVPVSEDVASQVANLTQPERSAVAICNMPIIVPVQSVIGAINNTYQQFFVLQQNTVNITTQNNTCVAVNNCNNNARYRKLLPKSIASYGSKVQQYFGESVKVAVWDRCPPLVASSSKQQSIGKASCTPSIKYCIEDEIGTLAREVGLLHRASPDKHNTCVKATHQQGIYLHICTYLHKLLAVVVTV